jgi:hypothetical protein
MQNFPVRRLLKSQQSMPRSPTISPYRHRQCHNISNISSRPVRSSLHASSVTTLVNFFSALRYQVHDQSSLTDFLYFKKAVMEDDRSKCTSDLRQTDPGRSFGWWAAELSRITHTPGGSGRGGARQRQENTGYAGMGWGHR